ncbi:uncharacterized protein LOC134214932 [Armigeres subalbatus]|uniref:uncharacterized protein LOC134214932 n=1 Tax=Armigeres subalbatus TaxID=124917 RepID=UPI002ECFC911
MRKKFNVTTSVTTEYTRIYQCFTMNESSSYEPRNETTGVLFFPPFRDSNKLSFIKMCCSKLLDAACISGVNCCYVKMQRAVSLEMQPAMDSALTPQLPSCISGC